MYPIFDIELSPILPREATFWTPKPSDIDEEGFGYFRDVFDLRDTTANYARNYLRCHRLVLDFIDDKADSVKTFERFAQAFEAGAATDVGLTGVVADQIDDLIESEDCDLGGLELGVGALAYALSAAKMFPAASCRSHVEHSWSPHPVLYVATNQPRALLLEELVMVTGCGFVHSADRTEFIVIASPSVSNFLDLAQVILENLPKFRKLSTRKSRTGSSRHANLQPLLFDD